MSNTIAMNVLSDAEIEAEFREAFRTNDKGNKLLGTAEQRAAFCVMLHHSHLVDTGKKPGALAAILTSKEAMKAMQDIMLAKFAPPLSDADKGKTDDARTAQVSQVARVELIKRALKNAACLDKGGVTAASFDRKKGLFTVPVSLFLFPGQEALGRLRKVDVTPMDSVAFNYEFKNAKGKDDFGKATTSTTRLREVNVPKADDNRGAGATQQKGKIANDAVPLVHALAKRLADDDKFTAKALQDDAFWNDLEMIRIWYDRQRLHPDFLKPIPSEVVETTEPVTAKQANGKKAAA